MEVSGNILELGVYQDDGAGQRRVFTRKTLTAGAELYPYLYIRGASTDFQVDVFNFSIDPWLPSIGGDERGNDEWQITGNADTGRFNGYDDTINNSVVGDVIPQIGYATRWNDESVTSQLIVQNPLLRGLGFNVFGEDSTLFSSQINRSQPIPWFTTITADVLPFLYTSDNYIVESMSLPLDSYDASKTQYPSEADVVVNPQTDKQGRRKNILMTIPENDNTTGLVEYESSTPIFIDINNAEDINAKNLNFRLLNKDFSPIVQADETAIMTILIKKPGE